MLRVFSVSCRFVAVVGLLLPVAVACSGRLGGPDNGDLQITDNLYGESSKFWTGAPPMVNVCWESMDGSQATYRSWIEDNMRRTWNRFARFNFVGWTGPCTSGQAGVHVYVNASGCAGQNPGVGTDFNGVNNGLGAAPCTSCGSAINYPAADCPSNAQECCVKKIAQHEFGHALGFYHEQDRPISGGTECPGPEQSIANGEYYGGFNALSPMSECGFDNGENPPPGYWLPVLHPGDIAAIQRAYGLRIPGSIVSPNGRCVASQGSAPGQDAFMWDCDEFENDQEWDYTVGGWQQLNVYGNSSLCLGTLVGSTYPVELISCADGDQALRWEFRNMYVRGWGKCMDLANGNTNGGTVQAWDCGAIQGQNQKWKLTTAGELRFGTTSACVTVPSSGSGVVTVTACSGMTRQKFTFGNSDQQIRSQAFPTKCLDIQAVLDSQYLGGSGLPTNGAVVQLYDCIANQFNQKWFFSGEVFNYVKGRCLRRAGDGNGAMLSLEVCDGSDQQLWDYYPL